MIARRASDDPRLPPLYEERDKLEGEAAAISRRLAEIQNAVLAVLHPHGAHVVRRGPLTYRRVDDPKVPMPAQTAVALGLCDAAPEPGPVTVGVGDDWHGPCAVGSVS
jgi:hypothetical protein